MKEKRFIDMYKVREMCIKYDWYTMGDNDEYGAMLNQCKGTISNSKLLKIATDIADHSDFTAYGSGSCYKENIESVLFYLVSECCVSFFELK